MLQTVFILLILFQVKHFLADFPLQNEYMLGKFKPGWDFLSPLLTHAYIHGILTLYISLSFTGDIKLSLCMLWLDIITHSVIDRIKASPKYLGRFQSLSPFQFREAKDLAAWPGNNEHAAGLREEGRQLLKSNKLFWWSLGADQMAHHLTHYAIIYFIVQKINS